MDEKLKKYIAQLSVAWKKIESKKKVTLVVVVLVVIAVIGVIIAVAGTPQYELLYSGGLNDQEAAQVYSAVQAQGIAAKVSGSSIYVKKGSADQVRMQLAEDGLPQGNLPYDIYSSGSTWAETDQDKQIKELQQVQNRLQDAIVTISGINRAIVTIAQGNDDTYVLDSDSQPTTASVMLDVTSGDTLSGKQVNAIIQMVAHSVPGLSTDNVSVTDQDGTPLTGDDSGIDATSTQLEMQNSYENAMKAKIIPMLQQIYGTGNVDVAVNANIDFSQKNTVTNTYSSGIPSSVSQSNQITVNDSGGASGVTGVNNGQPTYPTTSSQGGTLVTSQSNTATNYAVGSVQQQIQDQGGRLQKLTVAVLLNKNSPAASTTNTANLTQMIANAVGTTAGNISIGQMNFSSSSSTSSAQSTSGSLLAGLGINMLYVIAAGALLLIIILTLLMIFITRSGKKRKEKAQAELLAKMQAEAQAGAEAEVTPGKKKSTLPLKSIEETIEESQTNSMKMQIEEFADKKPELVAQILKNWLKD
jgi:flagellar M-ring protein FliF